MAPPRPPPARLRRLLGLLVVACALSAGLWWLDRGEGPGGRPRAARARSAGDAAVRPGDTGPRTAAALPTRTALSAEDIATHGAAVCPLEVVDHNGAPSDDEPRGPARFRVLLASGPSEAVPVVFGDGSLALPAEALARIQEGPDAEAPLLIDDEGGIVALVLDGGRCERALYSLARRYAVACPVAEGWDPAAAVLRVSAGGAPVDWQLSGGALRFSARQPRGAATVTLVDGAQLRVAWDDEGCDTIDPDRALATLDIVVTDRRLDPTVWVTGCGLRPRRVVANVSFQVDITPEPCVIEAWRTDGALRALAEPVYIDPLPGDELHLSLALPAHRMAGMGISFRIDEGAATVRGVRPGTPAHDAGLRRGDRILAVDGEAVEGMSDNDFIAFGTGPEGTVVELVVEDEAGDPRVVELERSLITR